MIKNTATCPLCGVSEFSQEFSASDADTGSIQFDLSRCQGCGLVRTEPFPTKNELDQYYGKHYYGQGERKFLPVAEYVVRALNAIRAKNMLKWLNLTQSNQQLTPRILDIGCGRGGLLNAFVRLGCRCDGLERAGYEVPSTPNKYNLYLGDIKDIYLPEKSYDIVVVWHVLEHLPEPSETIKRISGLLRSGGLLVLAVPNISSRQARWFSRHWFHLDLPRHIWHFSPSQLTDMCRSNGLKCVKRSGICLEQNVFGLLQSALNQLSADKPNRLYHVLQGQDDFSLGRSLLWLLSSLVLLPAALLESLVSVDEAHGATTVHYWLKP